MSVVMKFGGTSVADEQAVARVTSIVRRQIGLQAAHDKPPLVVVSALSKVTDGLLTVARLLEAGERDQATAKLAELADRHVAMASALVRGERREQVIRALGADFAVTRNVLCSRPSAEDVSPQMMDAIASTGELASSRLIAAALAEVGVRCAWIDARAVLLTDAEFTAAVPDMAGTCSRAHDKVAGILDRGDVAVLGGFIGSTRQGLTTTLGRGGSDYSAAIFGACLDVSEIQIWTDVDGMLTADPRVVPNPRLVPHLSFAEASELAYFGAKVLHPSTILPAMEKNIPVRILNSRRPDAQGTLITARSSSSRGKLTALACKRDVTVIDITSMRMFMAHGFLSRLFGVFERLRMPVDVVTTSEVSVSVTVEDTRRLGQLVESLREFAEVSVEPAMAIICAVGEDVHEDPKAFGRAVRSLEAVPLRMVSQAASRRNITFVVKDTDVPQAMTCLHNEFFPGD